MTVVTFGELLLRLSPPGHHRLVQAASFDAAFGGSEANVAVSLAAFGLTSRFVTKLPGHALGQAAVNHLHRYGVLTDHLVRGEGRMGLYFLETSAAPRPSQVLYDRAGSALTTLRPGEIDWAAVFDGAAWFHWSGITPALGPGPRVALEEACRAARAAGATVSCDLNYRQTLWPPDEARAVMRPLMAHVDVCLAGVEAADRALGLTADGDEEALARALTDAFGFRAVALTHRTAVSPTRHDWSAALFDADERFHRSPRYAVPLVGRVGAGDAFAAGLIYGLLTRDDPAGALAFAAAAAALKHTIPGDANLVSVAEVNALARGPAGARLVR